jgi:hypothetical protein
VELEHRWCEEQERARENWDRERREVQRAVREVTPSWLSKHFKEASVGSSSSPRSQSNRQRQSLFSFWDLSCAICVRPVFTPPCYSDPLTDTAGPIAGSSPPWKRSVSDMVWDDRSVSVIREPRTSDRLSWIFTRFRLGVFAESSLVVLPYVSASNQHDQ